MQEKGERDRSRRAEGKNEIKAERKTETIREI